MYRVTRYGYTRILDGDTDTQHIQYTHNKYIHIYLLHKLLYVRMDNLSIW